MQRGPKGGKIRGEVCKKGKRSMPLGHAPHSASRVDELFGCRAHSFEKLLAGPGRKQSPWTGMRAVRVWKGDDPHIDRLQTCAELHVDLPMQGHALTSVPGEHMKRGRERTGDQVVERCSEMLALVRWAHHVQRQRLCRNWVECYTVQEIEWKRIACTRAQNTVIARRATLHGRCR